MYHSFHFFLSVLVQEASRAIASSHHLSFSIWEGCCCVHEMHYILLPRLKSKTLPDSGHPVHLSVILRASEKPLLWRGLWKAFELPLHQFPIMQSVLFLKTEHTSLELHISMNETKQIKAYKKGDKI